MTPEERQMLQETYSLVRSNHRMLRMMRFEAWLAFLAHVLIWVVVIAFSYYFYQHYLAQYVGLLPSFADMQKLLNSVKAAP